MYVKTTMMLKALFMKKKVLIFKIYQNTTEHQMKLSEILKNILNISQKLKKLIKNSFKNSFLLMLSKFSAEKKELPYHVIWHSRKFLRCLSRLDVKKNLLSSFQKITFLFESEPEL